jgi:hypothetical protein
VPATTSFPARQRNGRGLESSYQSGRSHISLLLATVASVPLGKTIAEGRPGETPADHRSGLVNGSGSLRWRRRQRSSFWQKIATFAARPASRLSSSTRLALSRSRMLPLVTTPGLDVTAGRLEAAYGRLEAAYEGWSLAQRELEIQVNRFVLQHVRESSFSAVLFGFVSGSAAGAADARREEAGSGLNRSLLHIGLRADCRPTHFAVITSRHCRQLPAHAGTASPSAP